MKKCVYFCPWYFPIEYIYFSFIKVFDKFHSKRARTINSKPPSVLKNVWCLKNRWGMLFGTWMIKILSCCQWLRRSRSNKPQKDCSTHKKSNANLSVFIFQNLFEFRLSHLFFYSDQNGIQLKIQVFMRNATQCDRWWISS